MNYIFAYGSLLSEYSRRHYSNIDSEVNEASIDGWARSWCATYPDEGATYAGALRDTTRQLDGLLIPSEIDEAIAERERGYQFTRLNMKQLTVNSSRLTLTDDDHIWICESLAPLKATEHNPLPQSYVDTCISGCIESHGVDGATRFIRQTDGWDCAWVNDRHLLTTPIYPRYSKVSANQAELIDSLLEQHGVLKFRETQLD